MAATQVEIQRRSQMGRWKARQVKITGPAAYVTGGDEITPDQFGVGRVDMFLFSHTDASTGKSVIWDAANGKLKALGANGSEESADADLDAIHYYALVLGT
jgi:hypothetical protein